MKEIKEKYIYLLIFSIAFIVRIAFLVYNYNLPLWGDAISYHDLAKTLLARHAYIDNTAYTSPPGYPFFLSAVYYIFGENIAAVRIIQVIFDSLLCVLLYWLCRKLFNRTAGLVAGLFWAVYLLFIKASVCLFTESLFTFFLFLSIVCVYRSRERFSYPCAIAIGLLYSALSLTRAVILLFPPFLFAGLIIFGFYRRIKSGELTKKIAVVALAFLLPLSIWTYRNYRVYHAFVPVSTQGGYAFYNGYFPKQGKIYGFNVGGEDVEKALKLGSQAGMSSYLFRKTVEFIKNNPREVLRLGVLKVLYFWSPIDWEVLGEGQAKYNFQYVFMLPFSLFGILFLLKKFKEYIPLYAPLIYMSLIILIFFAVPRFRMPVEPYLAAFFSIGLYRFFHFFRRKYLAAALAVSYALINAFIYFHSAAAKYVLRGIFIRLGLW